MWSSILAHILSHERQRNHAAPPPMLLVSLHNLRRCPSPGFRHLHLVVRVVRLLLLLKEDLKVVVLLTSWEW